MTETRRTCCCLLASAPTSLDKAVVLPTLSPQEETNNADETRGGDMAWSGIDWC